MRQSHPLRTRLHGGNPWELMRQYGFSQKEIIDFSVDVNPLGFPASIREAITEHIDDIRHYPDPQALELREAIEACYQIPIEAILPGNGAAELISLVVQVRQPNKALIVVPTFGEYEWAVEQAGATPVCVRTHEADGFQPDLTQVAQRIDGVDLVFVCNPNNPTGTLIPREALLWLARRCHDVGAWLVIDEAFMEFVDDPEAISLMPDVMSLGHVMVLRSLTKSFAIPGLRLGFLVASPAIVERLRARQPAWPLNTFASAVGGQLCSETGYVADTRRIVAALRGELQQRLGAIPGLRPFPSVTNFILCKLTDSITSSELCERLARRGLLIRDCDSFTGLTLGRFIRIAVRTSTENRRLLHALRDALHPATSSFVPAEASHAG